MDSDQTKVTPTKASTLDDKTTVTLPPQDLLHVLATAINRSPNISKTTIPFRTTFREAIKAVEASLENLDEGFLVFRPGSAKHRRRLREEAQKVRPSDPPERVGLPVISHVDIRSAPRLPPPSEATREVLRDMARKIAKDKGT